MEPYGASEPHSQSPADELLSPSGTDGSDPSSTLSTKLSATSAPPGHFASGGSGPYPVTSRACWVSSTATVHSE